MGRFRSKALLHGEGAWGAKYVVRGFTRSPETDLLYGLGFPHLRRLDDEHPDNELGLDALEAKLITGEPDVPAVHAERLVRAMGVLQLDVNGSWCQAAKDALQDARPFTEESAAAFVKGQLTKKNGACPYQWHIAFSLEALVGPDIVAQTIVDVLEPLPDEALIANNMEQTGWAQAACIMLLRTSQVVGDALQPRLQKIAARGRAAGPAYAASITEAVDVFLNGHRAAGERKHYTTQLTWWSEAPKDVLLSALVAAEPEINKWSFSVEPRLAMLGGDAVIDLYRRKWPVLKDATAQGQLVAWFGEIAHPDIAPLMREMAEKSKAKKAARAWLDAAGGSPAAAKPAKGDAKKKAAAVPKLAVPALDPDVITAQLDAAVTQGNWPDFFELNPEDLLHGMRVVAARAGKDWGIAIERLQGDEPDSLLTRTWLFGSTNPGKNSYHEDHPISFSVEAGVATGPRGELELKKPKTQEFAAVARNYHQHFGGGLWPDASATARLLGLGEKPDLVVVSDAFAHVALTPNKKQKLPSQSKTFQSLAQALAAGDASLFKPGKSNV